MNERLGSLGRWIGIATLTSLLLRQTYRNGPYSFQVPATPVANTRTLPIEFRDFIRFLVEVRGALPVGARVAVVSIDAHTSFDDYMSFLVGIGQLPDCHLVFPSFRWSGDSSAGDLPEYVVAFQDQFADARFFRVLRLPLGSVSRRRQ